MSDPFKFVQGGCSALNITAPSLVAVPSTTPITRPVRLARVTVLVAGSAPGSVNDAATIASAAVANLVYVIPNTVGSVLVDWPCFNGLVVTPGTGQTVAVTYD